MVSTIAVVTNIPPTRRRMEDITITLKSFLRQRLQGIKELIRMKIRVKLIRLSPLVHTSVSVETLVNVEMQTTAIGARTCRCKIQNHATE
jgi:hypothetical protein